MKYLLSLLLLGIFMLLQPLKRFKYNNKSAKHLISKKKNKNAFIFMTGCKSWFSVFFPSASWILIIPLLKTNTAFIAKVLRYHTYIHTKQYWYTCVYWKVKCFWAGKLADGWTVFLYSPATGPWLHNLSSCFCFLLHVLLIRLPAFIISILLFHFIFYHLVTWSVYSCSWAAALIKLKTRGGFNRAAAFIQPEGREVKTFCNRLWVLTIILTCSVLIQNSSKVILETN